MDKNFYRIFFEVQKRHWWFGGKKKIVLDLISRLVPAAEHPKILDIGCGSGLMLNALEQIGETSGMDMSDDAISFSREIFGGVVKKGSLPDGVPYPDEHFSLVVALDVIEHVDDDRGALRAIHAKMAPDGRSVITVPAFMFLWSEHDVLNEHKRRYRLDDLKAKLLEAGFKVEKISYFNTFLFPLISLVRITNNLLKRKGGSDVELPPSFINYLLKHTFGMERYFLRFLNFPFGVSLLAVVRK